MLASLLANPFSISLESYRMKIKKEIAISKVKKRPHS
jgi:hypothetical protein